MSAQIWFLKVGVLGDPNVGKTDFCCSLLGKKISEEYFHYAGMFLVPYKVERQIRGIPHIIRLNLWFLSGKDVFLYVRTTLLKDCDFLILVFNPCKRSSFDNLCSWAVDIKRVLNSIPIFIIENTSVSCDRETMVTDDEIEEIRTKIENIINSYVKVFKTNLKDRNDVEKTVNQLVDSFIEGRFRELAKLT